MPLACGLWSVRLPRAVTFDSLFLARGLLTPSPTESEANPATGPKPENPQPIVFHLAHRPELSPNPGLYLTQPHW